MAAGRVVDTQGPEPLCSALVAALRARGGEIDRYSHRFHTYPARLHPDAARALLAELPGPTLLDPFCGGGTVLVEALVAGRAALGSDINPVALLVAKARTRLLDTDASAALRNAGHALAHEAAALGRTERARLPRAVRELRSWYPPHALEELGLVHELVEQCSPPERLLLRAVHSSLVVKYSRRESDTSAARVEVRDRPGQVLKAFRDRAVELSQMLGVLRAATPRSTPEPQLILADARRSVGHSVDLVCTSPPYPATYDYVAQQRLRMAWLAECAELPATADMIAAGGAEIGSRRSFRASVRDGTARWVDDTDRWISAVSRRLRDGGVLAVVVGDGIAARQAVRSRPATIRAAERAGLELWAAASIERVDAALGLDKREHALVFRQAGNSGPPHKREPPRPLGRGARR